MLALMTKKKTHTGQNSFHRVDIAGVETALN
jgi:hypothetical protein